MKKIIPKLTFMLLAGSALALGALWLKPGVQRVSGVQPAYATQGSQPAMVEADGSLRANQSALLTWQTSGTVEEVQVSANQPVSADQELATLDPASLPKSVILAQANLVMAQQALEDLLNSDVQRAQAQQAVEDAGQALDDLLNPDKAQAQALEDIATVQKEVDQAELQVYVLTTPPAQSVIEQTYANMLLAENKLNNTSMQLELLRKRQKKLAQLPAAVRASLRPLLQKGIEGLERQVNRDQMALDKATEKYNDLLEPAYPTDVAQAEAALKTSQAKLAAAQREWERQKSGPSQGEVAQAQARLADAQREWGRLKDGPDPADIAAAQARVAAAQAALGQARLTVPFSGVITRVVTQPGDQVSPGDLAFRLDDLSSLLADVKVSEIDINRVQVGQTALLTFDGVPTQVYHGTVVAVAPVGTVTEGVSSFTTTIELTDANQAVRPGMTVTAKIEVSSR